MSSHLPRASQGLVEGLVADILATPLSAGFTHPDFSSAPLDCHEYIIRQRSGRRFSDEHPLEGSPKHRNVELEMANAGQPGASPLRRLTPISSVACALV